MLEVDAVERDAAPAPQHAAASQLATHRHRGRHVVGIRPRALAEPLGVGLELGAPALEQRDLVSGRLELERGHDARRAPAHDHHIAIQPAAVGQLVAV